MRFMFRDTERKETIAGNLLRKNYVYILKTNYSILCVSLELLQLLSSEMWRHILWCCYTRIPSQVKTDAVRLCVENYGN
jgi:hypothetical protein